MTGIIDASGGATPPDTYFASAERLPPSELSNAVRAVTDSPILSATMEVFGGWVAVLNEHRQVLAVNHAFLQSIGVDDPASTLGLRPGELLRCVHSDDHDGGCGTSQFCATCGAVLAQVVAQETGQTQQRECVITTHTDDGPVDHLFVVHCCPLKLEGQPLLLLSMRDISVESRRGALERTFLHDISNLMTTLGGASEQLGYSLDDCDPMLLELIRSSAETLYHVVRVQKVLCQERCDLCELYLKETVPEDILGRIESIFAHKSVARDKSLRIERTLPEITFETDIGLLMRVLVNMVVNAFEASDPGDTVRVWAEAPDDKITFFVWSRPPIPKDVAMRVFQRYFSTKAGSGRGMGTYAMKLLGETLLKGKVSFTSTEAGGVTFSICCPRRMFGA